jgi:hypothetical protein
MSAGTLMPESEFKVAANGKGTAKSSVNVEELTQPIGPVL